MSSRVDYVNYLTLTCFCQRFKWDLQSTNLTGKLPNMELYTRVNIFADKNKLKPCQQAVSVFVYQQLNNGIKCD